MDFLKAEQISNSKWKVLAIPFGGPFRGKDIDGEYFSERTDIKPDWFPERPVMWHHGRDAEIKDDTLGIEDELTKAEDGWWATIWLDRSNRYWDKVNALLERGKVYGSSGGLSHLVRKAKDGELLVWPHIEQTLTPTPSNFFSALTSAKAVDHFSLAGIAVDPEVLGVADLPTDLPSGGDVEATRRRVLALANYNEARLKRL